MKRVKKVDVNDFKDESDPNKISLDKLLQATQSQSSPDQYFLKLLEHQHQNEYRMIWLTDRAVDDKIIINCKEAVKYCERV